jgi:iron(III) transport system permease protein
VAFLAAAAGWPSCAGACRRKQGRFVGLANFVAYAQTPALLQSLWNSLWVSALVTLLAVPLAFAAAYALTRSRMPLQAAVPRHHAAAAAGAVAAVGHLADLLVRQPGVLKAWLQAFGIDQIYGAPGIVVAEMFAVFPHALMILVTALGMADARLYEAADAMGTTAGAQVLHHHAAGRASTA